MLDKEAYEDISDDGTGGKDSNLEEIVRQTITNDAGGNPPLFHIGVPTSLPANDIVVPNGGGDQVHQDTQALAAELSRSQDYSKHLESKLGQANAKMLQLENENATGSQLFRKNFWISFISILVRGSVTEEMKLAVKTQIHEQLETFKKDLCASLHKEVSSSQAR